MGETMTVRLSDEVRARLRTRAQQTAEPPAALAQRLIDEGLRTEAHPGITFRPTPMGERVAGLLGGPDVVEVIAVIVDLDASGEQAVTEAAQWLALTRSQVRTAVRYYTAFPDDIDTELRLRRDAADETGHRWKREQELLS